MHRNNTKEGGKGKFRCILVVGHTEDAAPTTDDAAPTTDDEAPTTNDAAPTTDDAAPTTGAGATRDIFFASGVYIGGTVSPLLRFYCIFRYSIHFNT